MFFFRRPVAMSGKSTRASRPARAARFAWRRAPPHPRHGARKFGQMAALPRTRVSRTPDV